MADSDTNGCGCKVGRVADRHGLDELDAELLHRRRHDDASLRELADDVNRAVLSAALDGLPAAWPDDELFGAVTGERAVAAVYDALVDEAEPERRARVETRLEQHGVDVTGLRDDWVTHPTVRHHLRECLGVETGREGTIAPNDAVDTVEWARARAVGVVDRTIERLDHAGLVRTGDIDVSITIQLSCADCGNAYRPRQLIEAGGCACEVTDDGRV